MVWFKNLRRCPFMLCWEDNPDNTDGGAGQSNDDKEPVDNQGENPDTGKDKDKDKNAGDGKKNDDIQKKLEDAEKELENARKRIKELNKENEKRRTKENESKTEMELLQERLTTLENEASDAKKRARQAEVKQIANELGFQDAEDALLRTGDDVEDIQKHLTGILEAKPYLKKQDKKDVGGPTNPKTPEAQKDEMKTLLGKEKRTPAEQQRLNELLANLDNVKK